MNLLGSSRSSGSRRLALLLASTGLALLVASGCGPDAAPTEGASSPEAARAPRTSRVGAPSDLSLLEAPARVVAAPGSEARVVPSHEARVLAVLVREGDRVEAGAPIAEGGMPAVLEAAARLGAITPARALRSARQSELSALQGEGLVDRASVFEQETALASLDLDRRLALATLRAASLTTAEASRALGRGAVTLRAPIAGVVREVSAVVGEVRGPSAPALAVIAAPTPTRVEARFASGLPRDAAFEFVGLGGERIALADAPLSLAVDPSDASALAWFEPAEPTLLDAPIRGSVRVVPRGLDAVELDAHALVLDADRTFVERVVEGGETERVAVRVLATSSTRAIVRAEDASAHLAVGDRVSLEPAVAVVED